LRSEGSLSLALRRAAAMGLLLLAAAVVPSSARAQDATTSAVDAGGASSSGEADAAAVASSASDTISDEGEVAQAAEAAEAIAEEGIASGVDPASDAPAEEEDDGVLSFRLPLVGETTFAMTSTTSVRFRGQNYSAPPAIDRHYDDDFLSFQQRFDLALNAESLRLEARLDAFQPFFFQDGVSLTQTCAEEEQELCYLTSNYRLERIALRWDHESWSVVAGDDYAVLGRGIALSFRKYDLLGVDNALRGGRVAWDGQTAYMRAVGGVANPQNLDPTNLGFIEEPTDVVVGAEAGVRLGEFQDLELGMHATRVWFDDDPGAVTRDRAVDVAGWHVAAPALLDGQLALYAEVDGLRRSATDFRGDNREFGRAVYGSAQLQLERITLLAEWVDYRNYLVATSTAPLQAWRIYSSLPTMELDGLQRLRAIGNRRGGSLKFDYAFLPGPWSFSVNGLVYGLDEENKDPWDGVFVTHGWIGLRRRSDTSAGTDFAADGEAESAGEEGSRIGWSLETLVGYRRETFLHDPVGMPARGDLDRQVLHGEIDVAVAAGKHSFEVRVDHRFDRELRAIDYADYIQGGVAFTYTWGVKLAVSTGVRWNDEKAFVLDARAARDYNFLGGALYPSLEVRWNFTTNNFVSVFAGSTPGGRLCSGGVCRDVQAFEGVFSQLVLRI
jgi:hypothetical protein